MINVKKTRLSHKYCPHCKKDCNIKTYKDHKRLYFDSDTKSWYVSSASDGAAVESDIEGLSSSLSSEKEDYSGVEDNISQPMFEEAEEHAADNDSEPAGKSSFIILQNLRSFTIISLTFYRLSHRILV